MSLLHTALPAPQPSNDPTLINAAPPSLPTAQRFIILVPDPLTQEVRLAQAVWALAHARPIPLIFITLANQPAQVWRARRRLATLAALIRAAHHPVEAHPVTGNWLDAVRALWLPGDVVLCHAEQTLAYWGQPQPLAEVLSTRYQIPVYVLTGFYPGLNQSLAQPWRRELVFYAVAAVLLLGFLLLQVVLHPLEPMWLRQVLLAGSVLLECGALAFWHAYLFEGAPDD